MTKAKAQAKTKDELPVEGVVVAGEVVAEKIKKGETSLEVFSPIRGAIAVIVEHLKQVPLKPAEEATPEEIKMYKKYRMGVNKAIKVITERRKDITRKLDELKRGFIQAERELTKDLVEYSEKFKEILDRRKELEILEERKKKLPERMEKLKKLGIIDVTEEQLLAMTDEELAEFYVQKVEEKAEQERIERERKEREERIRREAEERARREAELKAKMEMERKIAEERERARREAEEKLRKEQEEARKKEEAAKKKAEQKLKEILKGLNYNPKEDMIKDFGGEIRVYKLVARINKKELK